MQVFKGDYLSEINKRSPLPDTVTVIDFIGDFGECRAKTFPESAFPNLKWRGFTLRGYGQVADIPRMMFIDMSDAIEAWNFRIVQNGAMVLYATRAERDAELTTDEDDN